MHQTITIKANSPFEQIFLLDIPDGYEQIPLAGRDDWTTALRSGEYRQGRGALVSTEGHCCLGVFCEVMKLPVVRAMSSVDFPVGYDFDGQTAAKSLPVGCPAQLTLGTHGNIPQGCTLRNAQGSDYGVSLTKINDRLGMSFRQIADLVEVLWSHKPLSCTPS